MKKLLSLGLIAIILTSCSMKMEELPPLDTTKSLSGNGIVSSVKNDSKESVVSDKEENTSDNDLYTILDDIKDVHPGTAGSSLKILYAATHLLNICKSKLPLDIMAGEWIDEQDKESYVDIKESFLYLFESLKTIKENDTKKIFEDNGLMDLYEPWDDSIYNVATDVIGTIIQKIDN